MTNNKIINLKERESRHHTEAEMAAACVRALLDASQEVNAVVQFMIRSELDPKIFTKYVFSEMSADERISFAFALKAQGGNLLGLAGVFTEGYDGKPIDTNNWVHEYSALYSITHDPFILKYLLGDSDNKEAADVNARE